MSFPPSRTAGLDTQSTANPLLSTQSRSELQIILHPLVLLAISDYISRHTLRNQQYPIIGGLLGQQNGREISVEHVFDCNMTPDEQHEGQYLLDKDFFTDRLEMMKQVHQDRHLDFVGWYTLVPSDGPSVTTLPVQDSFQEFNESAILLGFHPDLAFDQSVGSKLPLTIYESIIEVKASTARPDQEGAEDKQMEDSGSRPQVKFREVPYSVEVDQTEMISMNYVAGSAGGANLSANKDDKPSRSIESNGKGKRRLVESGDAELPQDPNDTLTSEEEKTIAFLTTKANAIKMLQSRIRLIKTYLETLPPSFVASGTKSDDVNMDTDNTLPSYTILRQIQALVSRLDLVVPSDKESFEEEIFRETNDANLVQLLNQVVQSASQARDAGKKFNIVEQAKAIGQRRNIGLDYQSGLSNFTSLNAGDIIA